MKKKISTALIMGIACGTLLFSGCGDNKSSDNSTSSTQSTTTTDNSKSSTGTVKENKKSMSESEKKAKIDELAQGMEAKKDDMTGAMGYTGPSIQQSISIIRDELNKKGAALTYRLSVIKGEDGSKFLMETVELDSNDADVMEDKLYMKSKNKLYTTEYNEFVDKNTQSLNDFKNDMNISGVRSIANNARITEIREAVDSGYVKIRVNDIGSHKNFDRELSAEEINMLSKVIQIYDLL